MKAHERAALAAIQAGDLESAGRRLAQRRVKLSKHHNPRGTSPYGSTLYARAIAEHLEVLPPAYLIADISVLGVVTLTRSEESST
jgi:hypothetical protein